MDNKLAIYASTLALYIYDATTFVLIKVLTVSDRTISGFDICPTNHNLVVITSIDGTTQVWNIIDEVKISMISLEGSGKNMALWNPFVANNIAIVSNIPYFRIVIWDTTKQSNALTEVFTSRGNTLKLGAFRWNPLVANQLAVGFDNGLVNVYDTVSRSVRALQKDGRTLPVVDLRWDRLSSIYLLVAYTSFISLWDVENQTEIHTFEKQNLPISSIAWMDWTAGNFISTNAKTGVIKVWNASQQQPLEIIKVGKIGINSNCLAVLSHSGIFAGVDGSIEVYNFDKKISVYSSEAAHSDTIFDCKFMTNSPDLLITASYDKTIKIWSVSNTKLVKTIVVDDGIIYNCDTNRKGTIVAAACQFGAISLWDTSTSRIIGRFVHHSKAAFSVAWNPHVDNVIASVSGDNILVVFKIDLNSLQNPDNTLHMPKVKGTKVHINAPGSNHVRLDVSHILLKFVHPAPVYGCSWNPKQSQFIATGCQDSHVRIFDYISGNLCYQLYGHSARSFNVIWSPLTDGRLASGSDDQKVIVWDINLDDYEVGSGVKDIKPTVLLVGHTSNVRALAWNYENKYILLSGSWDSTIRVWNVFTGNCIQVINNHSADVYSIISHPERPFTYASCSRDTTVRIFELEGIFELMRIKAIWQVNLESMLGSTATDAMMNSVVRPKEVETMLHVPAAMSGLKSLALNVYLTMSTNDQPDDKFNLANKYYKIFNFFGGSNGCLDIWEGILGGLSQGSNKQFSYVRNTNYRVVLSADEIIPKAKSIALKYESTKMTSSKRGELSSKVEEALRIALIKYAQIGDIEKCCSLLIELNEWTTALSIAPCVSMDYYKAILAQYSKILTSKSDDTVIPYMMGAQNYSDAIDFYLHRKDVASALVIAKVAESKPSKSTAMHAIPSSGYESKYDDFESDNASSKALMKSVIDQTSANFIEFSHPFLAAAQYISINDVNSALSILSGCGAYDLVYAIAAIFDVVEPYYIIKLAEKCAEFNEIQLAVTRLRSIKDETEQEIGLLLSKYAPEQAETILLSLGYHHLDYWYQKAKDEEAIGSDVETVLCYILAQNFDKSAIVGMNYLKRYIQEPIDLNVNSRKLIRYLKYINCNKLDPSIRELFKCYMYWFGAHEAAEIALWQTSYNMLHLLSEIDAAFIVSKDLILYQELCIRIMGGDSDVVSSINNIITTQTPASIVDSLEKLKSFILDASEKQNTSTWNRSDISRIWGDNTNAIFKEMQRMSNELSLPSLNKLCNSTIKSKYNSKVTCMYEVKNSRVTSFRPTSQGSKVPVAGNIKFSYISKKRITGLYIQINENGCREPLYAAVNEINEWKKILPYIL